MNGSKWSYIGVGTSAMVAFVGALVHSAIVLLIGAIFIFYNWHMAEYLRREEDKALVEFIRTSLKDIKE